jgi:hypothetical protein
MTRRTWSPRLPPSPGAVSTRCPPVTPPGSGCTAWRVACWPTIGGGTAAPAPYHGAARGHRGAPGPGARALRPPASDRARRGGHRDRRGGRHHPGGPFRSLPGSRTARLGGRDHPHGDLLRGQDRRSAGRPEAIQGGVRLVRARHRRLARAGLPAPRRHDRFRGGGRERATVGKRERGDKDDRRSRLPHPERRQLLDRSTHSAELHRACRYRRNGR